MPGKINAIHLKLAHRQEMRPVATARTVAGMGLEGDLSFGRKIRQVLLIEQETLDELGLAHGLVRENVVVEGLPLAGLSEGARLLLGSVLSEVTGNCAPCEDLIGALRPGLVQAINGRRGTFVRILEDGEVRVGDEVRIVVE